jgi:enoyl-[acyl-carrier protein] reductase I
MLTGFNRLRLVERIAQRLPQPAPVIELDVSQQDQLDSLVDRVSEHLGEEPRLDGVLHSIGFAPASCLGDGAFLKAPWADVATTIQVSAYSLTSLSTALLPLLGRGSSIVGMDFDNRQAWPAYDWMGVAKSALESVTRYLARDLGPHGIRVNLVAAGPIKTMAARSIPGFAAFEDAWDGRAPLGWDVNDPEPVARTVCALLSDWLPVTTGSMVWADGGFHAIGV